VPPTYATTIHDVIRRWTRERRAQPATLARADLGMWSCVLDLAFTGDREKGLRRIGWNKWLNAFDASRLAFLYRTHRLDGVPSMYFRLADVDTTARS
jgi:hypothetical protein